MSEVFNLDMSHLKGMPDKPQGGTKRPRDVTMDRSALENLGIKHDTDFKQGIKSSLTKWL